MGDAGSTMSGGGDAASGLANLFSALHPGGGKMDPRIEAYLNQQQISAQKGVAEQSIFDQQFKELMSRLDPELQKALAEQYTKTYGGAEQGAADYATSAFKGEQTPVTRNLIARLGTQVGTQRGQGIEQLKQRLAQSGVDPNSPAYQQILSNAENDFQGQFLGGMSDIENQQAMDQIRNAMGILQMGQTSNRLAGAAFPDIPLTPAQAMNQGSEDARTAFESALGSGSRPNIRNPLSLISTMADAGRAASGAYGNALSSAGYRNPNLNPNVRYDMPTYLQNGKPVSAKMGGGGLLGKILGKIF